MTRFVCVTVAAMTLVATGGAQDLGWHRLTLGEATSARLGQDVRRALARRFRVAPTGLVVELEAPRLEAAGDEVRLVAPRGRVLLREVDAWGLAVSGQIPFEGLVVDYRSLLVGELNLLSSPQLRPEVHLRRTSVETYMGAKGILDPRFEVVGDGEVLEIAGAYRLRLLLFHVRPQVRVRGRLVVTGARVGFAVQDVELRRVPGMMRSPMRRAVHRLATRGVFTELDLRGFQLAGGAVRVVDAAGETLYSQALGTGLVASE